MVENIRIRHLIADYLELPMNVVITYLNILSRKNYKYNETDIKILESLCLIACFNTLEKKDYFAIDPSFSFQALLIKNIWHTSESLHTIEDVKFLKNNSFLSKKLKKYETIVKVLIPIYNKHIPFLAEHITIIRGKEQISTHLCSLINSANNKINAVTSPPHLLGEVVWSAISQKMKLGIKYNRITEFCELNKHGYIIYKNEIEKYNEDVFIFNATLPQKFYIIDDESILFFSPSANPYKNEYAAQIINQTAFAKRFIANFDFYLTSSINLKKLLPNIVKLREDKLKFAKDILTSDIK